MPDEWAIFLSILAGITVAAAVVYYRQLQRTRREYEKAKGVVDDIVLSFNRQFKNDTGKLEALGYKVEAAHSRADGARTKAEELDGMLRALESRVATDSVDREAIHKRLAELERTASDAIASQQAITSKVATLEERANQLNLASEVRVEGVIPLKREKALSKLTNTEVAVLELLVSEGAKTAPEIKAKVRLSREHTARLMKNLYEEGYLERETAKIPFRYSVKSEMERLLKKTSNEAV